MKNAREYWSNQLSAIRTQGISCSAYAKQHDLSLASLYYWQRRLQSVPTPSALASTPKPQSKFVALRVSDAMPDMTSPSWCCTLVLTGGMRLELSALPDPLWLAAVGRANQVVH